MKHLVHRAAAGLLAAFLMLGMAGTASADGWHATGDGIGVIVSDYSYYPMTRAYCDGLLCSRSYYFDYYYIVPPDALCAVCGIPVTAELKDDVYTLTGDGIDLYYETKQSYLKLNGRYYYRPGGFLMLDNRVYIPVSIAEEIFQTTATVENGEVFFTSEGMQPVEVDEEYYENKYSEEDVFWLSRIIEAESYREALEGRIAIGNVVLNRVASDQFPDSIHDVIFDTNNGVQFAPILEVDIEQVEPTALSIAAACLCLDGCDMVGDCMFFVSPEGADTSWFDDNLQFYDTIGNLSFYRAPW